MKMVQTPPNRFIIGPGPPVISAAHTDCDWPFCHMDSMQLHIKPQNGMNGVVGAVVM